VLSENKEALMKSIIESPGVRIIYIFTSLLILINLSFADNLVPKISEIKKYNDQSKWSFSFYMAMAFGEPGQELENQMRVGGFDDTYTSFSNSRSFYHLAKILGKSWMIQVDYRMTEYLGMGFLYSNSLLQENFGHTSSLPALEGIIERRNLVKTISIPLSVYLNEYIVLGIGPSYNMTDSPSDRNKLGLLAFLNIRIPLSDSFSINGIFQYRYIGNTTIGPYYVTSTDDSSTPTVSTSTLILPPTEISYSHIFIGLGFGIHFIQQ